MTAAEFVKQYCEAAGWTEKEFYESQVPMPDSSSPSGWAAVSNSPLAIKAHVDLYMRMPLAGMDCDKKLRDFAASQTSLGADVGRALAGSLHELYLGDDTAPPAPVAVPDGWKLVPVEPTDAMCDISHVGVDVYTDVTDGKEYYSIGGQDAAKVYLALLAAAPAAPEQ